MDRPITITKKALPSLFLMLLLILSSGCSLSPVYWMPRASQYYLVEVEECKLTPQPTDEKVLQCSSIVKSVLRERFNNARLARTGGGAIQVLTAGISALLSGINGASALTASTILSGTSSMMPELSNIVEAKDRAEAYSEALKAIEGAEARYLSAIAGSSSGATGRHLSPAAAALYDTVRDAVNVLEKRLAAQLPSVEELQRVRAASERIEVIPESLSLKMGQEKPVQVAHGVAISTSSDKPTIAQVEHVPGANTAKIKAGTVPYGLAIITFGGSLGGRGTVTVRVEDTDFDLSPRFVEVKKDMVEEIKVIGGGEVIDWQPKKPKVAEVSIKPDKIFVKGKEAGEEDISFKNKSDRSVTVKVRVIQ